MWAAQPDYSSIFARQFGAVIDTIPALVWLANTEGAVEYLNRRWLEYTGLLAKRDDVGVSLFRLRPTVAGSLVGGVIPHQRRFDVKER